MNLKNILMVFYLIISAFYFMNFQASFLVYGAFLLNFSILTFITYYHLYLEKVFSPFLSTFIVFNYIFFLVAPMSQINEMLNSDNQLYVNGFPYQESLVFKTSILISVFNIIFFLTYDYLKKRKLLKLLAVKKPRFNKNLPTAIVIMVILCALIIITNLEYIIYEYNRPEWMNSEYVKSFALIRAKVLFIFPLGAIIACRSYFSQHNKNLNNIFIVLFSLLVVLFFLSIVKSPLITKRHDLGPILFLGIFLFFPRLLDSNAKFLNIVFFSIIIGLPLAQILTHTNYGITELIAKPSRLMDQINNGIFTDGYISLNYDAFLNIGVIIEVVQEDGFSYGYQLLSALLFFVPRSLWVGKPEASGMVVGNHLDDHYGFNFHNVSNPFLSEAYHNFGIFGIIAFGIALAIFCVAMLSWLHGNNWLKRGFAFYSALHLILILRGDFTSSFAYLMGTFLGIYYLPSMIIALCSSDILKIKKKQYESLR